MGKYYKYKGNTSLSTSNERELFERDIDDILFDRIWAARLDSLNDPNEFLYSIDEYLNKLIKGRKFLSYFVSFKTKQINEEETNNATKKLLDLKGVQCGIYSLSEEYNNELMWAHYGNSHKGYCIEYEFDKIEDLDLKKANKETHLKHFDRFIKLKYEDKIPKNIDSLEPHNNFINYLSQKSMNWKYEKEVRLITQTSGKFNYNPKVIKSIIFGLNCCPEMKEKIINKLKFKHILFYEIVRVKESYTLERKLIYTV
jgi:hypothetical protein